MRHTQLSFSPQFNHLVIILLLLLLPCFRFCAGIEFLWNKKTIDNSRGDNDENNRLVPNVFFQGSSTLDQTKDKNVQQQPKRTTKTFFFFFEWVARTHTTLYSYLIQVSRLNVLDLFYLY